MANEFSRLNIPLNKLPYMFILYMDLFILYLKKKTQFRLCVCRANDIHCIYCTVDNVTFCVQFPTEIELNGFFFGKTDKRRKR